MSYADEIRAALSWAHQFLSKDVGPEVFTELHDPGDPNRAWCGAFVRDILLQAKIKTPQGWDWVDNIRAWAQHHGVLVQGVAGAQPGDILIHGVAGGAHTGMATAAAQGQSVLSISGNAYSTGGTVAQQNMSRYWQWHVNMHGAAAQGLIQHGVVAGGGATAAAAGHHGGIAAIIHAGAAVQAAAFFAGSLVAWEFLDWASRENAENVALIERIADDPTIVQRDPLLATQLELWRQRQSSYGIARRIQRM
jgi:hypothetical protein